MGGVYPDRTLTPPERLTEVVCLGVGAYFDGCSVEPETGVTDGSVGWRVGAGVG